MVNFPENKKVILFDGICNLCNSSIQFIIKHDEKDLFRFAPLQSDIGLQIVNEHGIDTKELESIILIEPGVAFYQKSTAALEIAKDLKGYSWLKYLKRLPEGFRDFIYEIISNNRYQWFGKKESCMIPTDELRALFLK